MNDRFSRVNGHIKCNVSFADRFHFFHNKINKLFMTIYILSNKIYQFLFAKIFNLLFIKSKKYKLKKIDVQFI